MAPRCACWSALAKSLALKPPSITRSPLGVPGISDGVSGRCPIHSDGLYVPRHDPFLFFQDVVGSPPSTTNDYCAAHHRPLTALAGDLAAVASWAEQAHRATEDIAEDEDREAVITDLASIPGLSHEGAG